MAIRYSNLLVKSNEPMSFGENGTAMPYHEEAIKSKVLILLKEDGFGGSWFAHFLRPAAATMILQQDFKDTSTMCVFIAADGRKTHFDNEGNEQQETENNCLENFVYATWEKLQPANDQGYKTALILSASEFGIYMNNMCNNYAVKNYKDSRFKSAFVKINEAVKCVNI